MADELIDICDEFNNLTGVKKMKSEAHRDGLWHRSAHIWIYNSKGEILIQLRAKEKPLFPDIWDISVAGHVGAGENPTVSGLRELAEEIGLKVEQKNLHFYKIKKVQLICKELKNNEFGYVHFLKFDGDIKELKIQDEELQEIKFLPIEKLETELKTNPGKYMPLEDYWFEAINEVKKILKI